MYMYTHTCVCVVLYCVIIYVIYMMFYVSMRGREKTSQHKNRHETT